MVGARRSAVMPCNRSLGLGQAGLQAEKQSKATAHTILYRGPALVGDPSMAMWKIGAVMAVTIPAQDLDLLTCPWIEEEQVSTFHWAERSQ